MSDRGCCKVGSKVLINMLAMPSQADFSIDPAFKTIDNNLVIIKTMHCFIDSNETPEGTFKSFYIANMSAEINNE